MAFLDALGATAGSYATAKMSAKQAKKQRQFQERMTRNRYQYTMEDMKKAGLNPILAYKQGGGQAPPGAMGQVPDFGQSMAAGMRAGTGRSLAKSQKALMATQEAASIATARNQNAAAQGAEFENIQKGVLSEWYGTPSGKSAAIARETAGGGPIKAAAGALGTVFGAVQNSAKTVKTPRGPRVLTDEERMKHFGPSRKPNWKAKGAFRQRPLWQGRRKR